MPKYSVKFTIPLTFTVEVEADSRDDAIDKAYCELDKKDFLEEDDKFYENNVSLMKDISWGLCLRSSGPEKIKE